MTPRSPNIPVTTTIIITLMFLLLFLLPFTTANHHTNPTPLPGTPHHPRIPLHHLPVRPPSPPSSNNQNQKRTTTVSSTQPLTDLTCLQSPPPSDPLYFFDLFLEDVRNWVCIDHGQRKTFYHGKDRFVVVNNSGERRCIKKRVLMGYVKVLWEMAMKTCERSGAMGREEDAPGVAVYLFGGAAGL